MNPLAFIVFLFIGVIVGFLNVTGGGGGLITTPLLLAIGINPYVTLATSKFVPIGGLIVGGAKYYNAKIFTRTNSLFLLIAIVSVGAIIAANLTLHSNALFLKYIILIATVCMLIIIVLKKEKTSQTDSENTTVPKIGFLLSIFFISIYQGSIGIGGGVFLAFALRQFMHYSYVKSAALMNVLTIFITLASAITFAAKGVINYEYGVPLFIGSIVGGYIGAHIAIKKGEKLLKIITILIAASLIVKVLLS